MCSSGFASFSGDKRTFHDTHKVCRQPKKRTERMFDYGIHPLSLHCYILFQPKTRFKFAVNRYRVRLIAFTAPRFMVASSGSEKSLRIFSPKNLFGGHFGCWAKKRKRYKHKRTTESKSIIDSEFWIAPCTCQNYARMDFPYHLFPLIPIEPQPSDPLCRRVRMPKPHAIQLYKSIFMPTLLLLTSEALSPLQAYFLFCIPLDGPVTLYLRYITYKEETLFPRLSSFAVFASPCAPNHPLEKSVWDLFPRRVEVWSSTALSG